jgi:hypothetical protein
MSLLRYFTPQVPNNGGWNTEGSYDLLFANAEDIVLKYEEITFCFNISKKFTLIHF